eukprot:CAMPEP_0177772754 /NCGR_PEP_ID=MMETSP0491_2-20121128/12451_1 /TAXON_ID=63592 /ORGANISM="Tetraselmis chuii, Strain PLY429" /LENGTH=133 /DNA_ID=CAMNT_0019290705 /DNA_START=273 /DNA_END=671 /DNA_ORIENTATION=+
MKRPVGDDRPPVAIPRRPRSALSSKEAKRRPAVNYSRWPRSPPQHESPPRPGSDCESPDEHDVAEALFSLSTMAALVAEEEAQEQEQQQQEQQQQEQQQEEKEKEHEEEPMAVKKTGSLADKKKRSRSLSRQV